jgi:magnesium-transporting ATPase (P-type)
MIKIFLYFQGADTVIFERLSRKGEQYKDITLKHLEEFANTGYRTLCFAYSEISENFYSSWNEKFVKASNVLTNREVAIDEVAKLIEVNLILLGATAVEDKLQDQVSDEILFLNCQKLMILFGKGTRNYCSFDKSRYQCLGVNWR